jgi:hypothetical protein
MLVSLASYPNNLGIGAGLLLLAVACIVRLTNADRDSARLTTTGSHLNASFELTSVNDNDAPLVTPEGMVWITGGPTTL